MMLTSVVNLMESLVYDTFFYNYIPVCKHSSLLGKGKGKLGLLLSDLCFYPYQRE